MKTFFECQVRISILMQGKQLFRFKIVPDKLVQQLQVLLLAREHLAQLRVFSDELLRRPAVYTRLVVARRQA